MGSALSAASLVGISTVALVVMAIFIIIAQDRLRNISGFNTDQDLQQAHDKLVIAQILAWIAAALALILVFGYFVIHAGWTKNEWLHLILWLGIFGTLIASGILLSIALGDISRSTAANNAGADGWTWAALGVGIGAFVLLLISGGWRIYHKSVEEPSDEEGGQLYHIPLGQMGPTGQAETPDQHTFSVSGGGAKTSITTGQNGYTTETV